MKTKYRGAMVSPFPKAEDLEALFSHNANLIRYQMYVFDAEIKSLDEWKADILAQLAHFDAVVAPVITTQKVVLDVHTPPKGQKLWDDQVNIDALKALWIEIALRYKDNPKVYAYDICNEPPGTNMNVEYLMTSITGAIRKIDQRRMVIVSPPHGDPRNFPKLKKSPYKNIIYTAHFYRPGSFTGQGINGEPTGKVYPTMGCNRQVLEEWLYPIVEFQRKNKVSNIYIGEFSASAFGKDQYTMAYIRDLIYIFEKYAWQWSFHAWREAECWSPERSPEFLAMMTNAWSKNT